MKKNLKQRIEERQNQAEEREIELKAIIVAGYLGESENMSKILRSLKLGDVEGGRVLDTDASAKYQKGNFAIIYQQRDIFVNYYGMRYINERNTTIKYRGKLVFEQKSNRLEVYIPSDEWEKKLDRLVDEALKKRDDLNKAKSKVNKAAKMRRNKKKEAEMKKKFGL